MAPGVSARHSQAHSERSSPDAAGSTSSERSASPASGHQGGRPSSSSGTGNHHHHVNPRIKQTLADKLAVEQGMAATRKRKRLHYSCATCHRRKQKCDRNIPCQPCLDKGIGDDCRPFQDGDEHGDERDRLKRLEDLVEGLARAHATLSDDFKALQESKLGGGGGGAGAVGQGWYPNGEARLMDGIMGKGEPQDSEPGGSGNDKKRARLARRGSYALEREELQGAGAEEEPGQQAIFGLAGDGLDEGNSLEGGLTREGDSFYGALALPSISRGVIETQIHGERLELSSNVPLRSASAKVRRLIQEGGAPPNVIDELMKCLPPRSESDAMLEWFFRDINDTRLPLHERTFRGSYEEIMNWRWGQLRDEEGDDGARHIPFLSFLFIILATAKRSEPEDRCREDEDARRGALFYLHCARRSMAIASAVRADHIDVLLAAMYGARLLITLRQSAESWSLLGVAIRAAQAIGLHRDGTKLGLDAITTERRRRLWAMLYYLDRTTSMLLGRPQAIDDKTADTLPPSDVDIDVLPRMGPAPTPQPFPSIGGNNKSKDGSRKPPGVFCFVAVRHEQAKLIGRISEHFQDLSKPRDYADVLRIDADMQRYYANIPSFYLYKSLRGDDADYSFDRACPWLPIHRYLLNVEYHYARNTLHRPYLLRSERYKQSRTAAFAASKADRIIRKEYVEQVSWPSNRARNTHLGGVYRKFASTLTAGIELLLNPKGENSAELHDTLDEFLNSSTKVSDPSQCTKRELAIIQIFKAKALDPSWSAATAIGARKESMADAEAAGRGAPVRKTSGRANTKGISRDPSFVQPGSARAQANGANAKGISTSNPTAARPEQAQALLNRLGSFAGLNVPSQSPASSGASPSVGSGGATSMGTLVTTPDAAATTIPVGLAGMAFPQQAGAGSAASAANQNLMFGMPSTLDGLFESSDGSDWFSLSGTLDANAGGMGMDYGMNSNAGQSTPGAGPIPSQDFAGWGSLVEAIVSGQDAGSEKSSAPGSNG